jgi:hypothetical protein
MNQKNGLMARQNDIWLSRKIGTMQPKPVAESVKTTSNSKFWGRIACPNFRHVCTTPFGCKDIHWSLQLNYQTLAR